MAFSVVLSFASSAFAGTDPNLIDRSKTSKKSTVTKTGPDKPFARPRVNGQNTPVNTNLGWSSLKNDEEKPSFKGFTPVREFAEEKPKKTAALKVERKTTKTVKTKTTTKTTTKAE